MASLDSKITKTQQDGEKVEEEETALQKKRKNQWDQAQDDVNKAKTTASDGDLLDATPTLSLPRCKRLADSNASTEERKRQGNKITVKSKDIDGGKMKIKSDVGSEPFKVKTRNRNRKKRSRSLEINELQYNCSNSKKTNASDGDLLDARVTSSICRRRCYREIGPPPTFGEGETKNEWFKIQTFDLRGKGGGDDTGAGGGGGGGAVGGSSGNTGVTGGQQG